MANYKPSFPFNVPALILNASWSKVNGVDTKTFIEGQQIFINAKSYGGTEKIINNQYIIIDTLTCETYFTPNLKSEDRIKLLDDNSVWEVMNTPEDIDRRHQFLKFKVQRIKGNA